ncbi:unnamed protein product [Lactuca saligna]|uniref:Uncharacterized protein n=1 Tax=Lactuca saligna TaxID=75948 RepID=A0AA35YJN7_LACSI|nr:unnamed protein product [Lactuca saligna]
MGENVMQEGYNMGESVVQQVPVVEVPTIVEEGGTSHTIVMQGSDTFGQVGSSIGWKLKSINDEIEQGIDAILQWGNFTNSSPLKDDNVVDDNKVIEFIEGKHEAILPENIQLGLLDIANMLEAGYSMIEIEAIPGVQVELDDSPPVELDVNDFIDGHHSDDGVGLDDRYKGVGDEAIGDGAGPEGDGDGPGDEDIGDSDEEGHGLGDVDDGDGPEGGVEELVTMREIRVMMEDMRKSSRLKLFNLRLVSRTILGVQSQEQSQVLPCGQSCNFAA